ncbi:MAG: hypothetical protein U1F11_04135 [Steroidobacteraceae bacterium]
MNDPGKAAHGGMRHRAYRGRMLYLTDGIGEMGREFFSVTVQPDGERTLRAQCEMDDDRILRDVLLTVDGRWRPRDAFVRLALAERLVGASWFRFDGRHALCHGVRGDGSPIEQRFEHAADIEAFGTHALHNDAWLVGRLRRWHGPADAMPLADFTTSTLANGGSGPELVPLAGGFSRVHDLGAARIEVPAGTFDTHHVRVEIPGVDDFDVWAGGEDCLPVQLRSRGLRQTYVLTEVEGDWR